MKVTEQVESFAKPIVESFGCKLWDVEYVREGSERFLRLYIDKDGGVDIEDCEKMARAIDPIIDEADPIEVSYQLEVSSPGIERVIRTDAHIAFCMGEEIEARTFAPQGGKKSFVGILSAYENGAVTLVTGEGEVTLPREAISLMNVTYHE